MQPAQPEYIVTRSTGPDPEVRFPTGEKFQVMSLELKFKAGLGIAKDYGDSSDEESEQSGDVPSHKVRCEPAIFIARVHFTGNAGWKIGWVQTVEPADFWVDYRNGKRTARHRTTMQQRRRDGDAKHHYWYNDDEGSCTAAKPGADVTVEMDDDPNVPFYASGTADIEGLADSKPTGCGGQKEFRAWLVAVREDARHMPAEVVYLHYVRWKVDFACEIKVPAEGEPTVLSFATSGASLITHGAGDGGVQAVLDGPTAGPQFEVSTVTFL